MSGDTLVSFFHPAVRDKLNDPLRDGARRMRETALNAEAEIETHGFVKPSRTSGSGQ